MAFMTGVSFCYSGMSDLVCAVRAVASPRPASCQRTVEFLLRANGLWSSSVGNALCIDQSSSRQSMMLVCNGGQGQHSSADTFWLEMLQKIPQHYWYALRGEASLQTLPRGISDTAFAPEHPVLRQVSRARSHLGQPFVYWR